jgi:hypothetical protein
MEALWKVDRFLYRPQLADHRPILGPEAAGQPEKPTVASNERSRPVMPVMSVCFGAGQLHRRRLRRDYSDSFNLRKNAL